MQRWRAIVLSAAMAILADSAAAETGNYRLDSGDELRVSVLENPQLTGVYTVADDGTIALPALERITVRGLTLEQATKIVREKVVQRIVDPSIAIEIAKYRPFFILGDVANPGMYPSMPGLSLIKAVAIAGGYRGKSDYFQMAISGIRAAESLAVARQLLLQTRVQIARLEAELSGSKTFEFAADSSVDASTWREIIERERQILHERTVSTDKQMELLANERRIRDDEIAALQARIEAQAQEAESLKAEVREVQDMVRKGLAPTARLATINREEIRARSDALQTTILLNQSRQARNQIDLQLSTLERARRMQALTEMQDATSRMQRLRRQLQADEAVVMESNSLEDSSEDGRLAKVVFHVRRKAGGELQEISAENTEVQPGDVIRVERRLVKGGPQK